MSGTNGIADGTNGITLRPCPFCGGEAEIVTIDPWYKNAPVGVGCSKCSVILAEFSTYKRFGTEAEAIEAWNTRTPEQAVDATLGSDKSDECYLMYEGKKYPATLDFGFLDMMPITITVGGFRYLVEVPDGE